jgi:hypothetical protein
VCITMSRQVKGALRCLSDEIMTFLMKDSS